MRCAENSGRDWRGIERPIPTTISSISEIPYKDRSIVFATILSKFILEHHITAILATRTFQVSDFLLVMMKRCSLIG